MDVTSSRTCCAHAVATPPAAQLNQLVTAGTDTFAVAGTSSAAGTDGTGQQETSPQSSARVRRTLVEASKRLRTDWMVPKYQWNNGPLAANHGRLADQKNWVPTKEKRRRKRKSRRNHPLTPEPGSPKGDAGVRDVVDLLRQELMLLRLEVEEMRRESGKPLRSTTAHHGHSELVSPLTRDCGTQTGEHSWMPSTLCLNCAQSESTLESIPEEMEWDDEMGPDEVEGVEPVAGEPAEEARAEETEVTASTEEPGCPGEPKRSESPTPSACGLKEPEDLVGLVEDFERYIYMKTQLMKRDQAFCKMLPGLMQRWIRSRKLESMPQDFIDCLTKACTERVMPSNEELGLSAIMADPDTRCAVERLNDAIKGEVHVFDQRAIARWCDARAQRIPKWWLTWPASAPLGWWPEGHWTVPLPGWGMLVAWSFLLLAWTVLAPAIGLSPDWYFELPMPWIRWSYGEFPWISWDEPVWWEQFTVMGTYLRFLQVLKWLTYAVALRKLYYRFLYNWPEYVSAQMWRDPTGGIRVFNSGNGKSQ